MILSSSLSYKGKAVGSLTLLLGVSDLSFILGPELPGKGEGSGDMFWLTGWVC